MKKEHKAVITAFENKMVQLAANNGLTIKVKLSCLFIGSKGKVSPSKCLFDVTVNKRDLKFNGSTLNYAIKNNKIKEVKPKRNPKGLNTYKGVENGIRKCFDFVYNADNNNVISIEVVEPFVNTTTGLTIFTKSKIKVVFSTNEEMIILGNNLFARFKAGKFYPLKFTKTVKKNISQAEKDLQAINDLILGIRARNDHDNSDINSIDIKVSVNEGKYQSVISFLNGQKPKEIKKRTHSYIASGWIASSGIKTFKIGSSSNVQNRVFVQLENQFDFKLNKLKYVFDNNASGVYIDYERLLLAYLKEKGIETDKQHLSGTRNNLNQVISDEFAHKRMKKHIKEFVKIHSHALIQYC